MDNVQSHYINTRFWSKHGDLEYHRFSRRWGKLNFGPLQGHFKSCYFPERIEARRQYFEFFLQISRHSRAKETAWTKLLDNGLGLLLPFKRN